MVRGRAGAHAGSHGHCAWPCVANDRFRHRPRPSRRRGGSASSARTTDRRTRRWSRPWPRRQTGDSRGWRPALMTKYGYQSLRPPFRIGSGDLWTPVADRPGPGRPRLPVIHRPGRGRGRDVVAPCRRAGPTPAPSTTSGSCTATVRACRRTTRKPSGGSAWPPTRAAPALRTRGRAGRPHPAPVGAVGVIQ